MKNQKILSGALALALVATSVTPAYAAIDTAGGTGNVPVELTQATTSFSVTVPTVLPIDVDEAGIVTVATENKIINNSFGPVEITGVEVEPQNDWQLVDFETDFTQKKVGLTEFGFQINEINVETNGNCDAEFDVIEGNSEINFTYDANVAAQSSALEDVEIAQVVFTVGWHETIAVAGYRVLSASDSWYKGTTNKSNITEISILNETVPESDIKESWDASSNNDGSVMAYVLNDNSLVLSTNGRGNVILNSDSSNLFSGFTNATALNNLDKLDTRLAVTLEKAFLNCSKIEELDLSSWNVSKVSNMGGMFGKCSKLSSLDLSAWKTNNLNSMYAMFTSCSSLTSVDFTGWDTSNVTNVAFLFNLCNNLQSFDATILNDAKPTSFQQMFQQCGLLTELDVSGWDTSDVSNMSFAFYNCDGLTTLAVEDWNVTNVVNFDHTFAHCNNLVVDVSNWRTSSECKYYGAMFHSNANTVLDVSGFNTSGAITLFSMFEANYNLEKIIGLENFNTSNSHSFEEMFNNCYKLKELDLSSFDTRKADNDTYVRSDNSSYVGQCTNGMIIGCRSLEKITLGENFTFAGDGTSPSNYISTLPTPSSSYVNGADGKWYNVSTGKGYTPAEILDKTAATYVSSPDLLPAGVTPN